LNLDAGMQCLEAVSKVLDQVAPMRRVDDKGGLSPTLCTPLEKKEGAYGKESRSPMDSRSGIFHTAKVTVSTMVMKGTRGEN
jgi:hypothetical protein